LQQEGFTMHKVTRAALVAATLLSLLGTPASAAKDGGPLDKRFQQWLDEVAILITPPEREAFLALTEDSRRDAFIAAFWKARDPNPTHPDGSFRRTYYRRRQEAVAEFQSVDADAAKVWILNGEPAERYPMDCGMAFWPIELWYYRATPRMTRAVTVIFYRPAAGPVLRIWHPQDGTYVLMAYPTLDKPTKAPLNDERGDGLPTDAGLSFANYVHRFCLSNEETMRLIRAVREVQTFSRTGHLLVEAPPEPDPEWMAAFAAGSTDAPEAAEPLGEAERRWLDDVAVLITGDERRTFMALPRAYQRAGFVEAFWKARDTNAQTPEIEARAIFETRLETARDRWRSITVDQARVYLLNGEPAETTQTDCNQNLWPLEIWHYAHSDRSRRPFDLLFFQPGGSGPLRLWHADLGYEVLQRQPTDDVATNPNPRPGLGLGGDFEPFYRRLRGPSRRNEPPPWCPAEADPIVAAMRKLEQGDRTLAELVAQPPEVDSEWLAQFAANSLDVAAPAEPLTEAELGWLDEVAVLITLEERRTFMALPRAYQRAGFVEAFWKARDLNPKTPENEARAIFEARIETARERWRSITVDQARIYLLNGEPAQTTKTDCNQNLWPLEIWHYAYSDRSRRPFDLLFYQSGGMGSFHLWHVDEGYAVLQRRPTPEDVTNPNPRPGFGLNGDFAVFYKRLRGEWCPPEAPAIVNAMRKLEQGDRMLAEVVEQTPPTVDPEWLGSFRTVSTELGDAARPLAAELRVDFPGRHQSRTQVRGTVLVPADAASTQPARAFALTGEVLRGDVLHESFRYYFQLSAPGGDGNYPLVFERFLRPGEFRLVVKVEDAGSGQAARIERDVVVPAAPPEPVAVAGAAAAPVPQPGAEGFRLLAPATDLVSGTVRIDAEVGDARVRTVDFSLDDKPLLTKRRPPWSVELRLGLLPRSMRVRAVARDAAGAVVAEDELQLNPAPHRFAVRLVEPREGARGGALRAPLRIRAEVQVPPDQTIDRLEVFLDDVAVATLFQEPWQTVVPALPSPLPTFLRAVAHLADGTTAEDVVVLAGGDTQRSRLEVDLVEVYTAALDGQGRPVQDLGAADFTVYEDGRLQALQRFQRVTDLPLQVGMLVDTSASMEAMLPSVQEAALRFFRDALRPTDRATVVTFSEEPRLAAPFTNDLSRLGAALVGLQAARGTALWDSVVYTLHYFQGTPGRRALLVFSDGADHGSRYTFDQALAYAEHSGVSVYALSFGGAASSLLEVGRRRLANLAEATGGRSFVLAGPEELAATYTAIDEDLRSQYLLVYQSDGEGESFRAVDVQIRRPGVTARTMRGYVP
jgi:VWFA-related protein